MSELTASEIHRKLRQFVFGDQKPISKIAQLSGLDVGTVNIALQGQMSDRTRKKLSRTFINLDTVKPSAYPYPTTRAGRRRRTLFVLIRLAIKHRLGAYGQHFTDESRDPLLIALKSAYKRPTDDAWRSVNQQYLIALIARFGGEAKIEEVKFNTSSALRLIQKLQRVGLLLNGKDGH